MLDKDLLIQHIVKNHPEHEINYCPHCKYIDYTNNINRHIKNVHKKRL